MNINIETMIEATGGQGLNLDVMPLVRGLEIDSRKVGPDLCFMPILGESFDGHAFIQRAFDQGSLVSFCEKSYYYSHDEDLGALPLILVDNTTHALQNIAKYIIDKLRPIVVGITGSVGKTSTKEFVDCVLKKKYRVHKNKGNFNNHIGLPLTVLDLTADHQVAILEMGMNHNKEIQALAAIARPNIGVITNIGCSHIGNLGSQEKIFQTKLEITSYLQANDALVLNGQDPFLTRVVSEVFDVYKVGSEDLRPYDITLKPDGSYTYGVTYDHKAYTVDLKVLGKHNIQNSLLAFRVGLRLGVDPDKIVEGLGELVDNAGRLDIFRLKNDVEVISDCYNASEDSTGSALQVLGNRKSSHKIAILGDVLELGDYSQATHKRIGIKAAAYDLTLLAYGQASRDTLEAFSGHRGGGDHKHFMDQAALLVYLRSILKPDTSILVKGSFGMDMIKIVEELIKE